MTLLVLEQRDVAKTHRDRKSQYLTRPDIFPENLGALSRQPNNHTVLDPSTDSSRFRIRIRNMSTSSQHQFRYTQTPSKVLHLRNLPWECAEEELVELCKPFGKIVNTKSNVGANRNQAFVEFVSSFFSIFFLYIFIE